MLEMGFGKISSMNASLASYNPLSEWIYRKEGSTGTFYNNLLNLKGQVKKRTHSFRMPPLGFSRAR
jgi:hypothetical protein